MGGTEKIMEKVRKKAIVLTAGLGMKFPLRLGKWRKTF